MKKVLTVLALLFFASPDILGQNSWSVESTEMIVTNPPFKQCHASTLVAITPQKIMAAWFAGSREGANDVSIWGAECNNGKWTEPKVVVSGTVSDSVRYPAWNPVLFKAQNGRLFLFYKVGPSPQRWWGMVMTSDNDGKTWSAPNRLPDGILGTIKNKNLQLKEGSMMSG